MVSVKDLQDIVDDLKGQARKKAVNWIGEGRGQMRDVVGGHSDGAMFGVLALGLIVGCLAGAAIALLVTPVSGVEARKRIGEQVVKAQQSRVPEELPTNGSTRSSSYTPASPYVAS